jgi:hypothetical protein
MSRPGNAWLFCVLVDNEMRDHESMCVHGATLNYTRSNSQDNPVMRMRLQPIDCANQGVCICMHLDNMPLFFNIRNFDRKSSEFCQNCFGSQLKRRKKGS